MPKNKEKNKEKKSNIIKLALLCLFAYLIYELVMVQIQISENKKELSQLNLAVEEQITLNEELNSLVSMGDDAEYMKRIARELYNYVYPGEIVFFDMSGE